MSAIVLSSPVHQMDVETNCGRIAIQAGLFTVSMTVEEARQLATKLHNAAVMATAMVEVEV